MSTKYNTTKYEVNKIDIHIKYPLKQQTCMRIHMAFLREECALVCAFTLL